MSFTRAEAVRLIKAQMAYFGVDVADLRPPRAPRRAAAPPASVVQTAQAAPPPKPVARRGRTPSRPPGRPEPVVVPPPRALAAAQTVETAATVHTVCPSLNHDPRYQVAPGAAVEGAGFVREWRSRRTT